MYELTLISRKSCFGYYSKHLIVKFLGYLPVVNKALENRNWLQENRHRNRGSIYLFAPMVEFNVMSDVGDTPP